MIDLFRRPLGHFAAPAPEHDGELKRLPRLCVCVCQPQPLQPVKGSVEHIGQHSRMCCPHTSRHACTADNADSSKNRYPCCQKTMPGPRQSEHMLKPCSVQARPQSQLLASEPSLTNCQGMENKMASQEASCHVSGSAGSLALSQNASALEAALRLGRCRAAQARTSDLVSVSKHHREC